MSDIALRSDGRPKKSAFSDTDCAVLTSLYRAGVPIQKIADTIGQSRESVTTKLSVMRRNGLISSSRTSRSENLGTGKTVKFENGIALKGDRDLVRLCSDQGGFPQAMSLPSGRTFWVTPNGDQWMHIGIQDLRTRKIAA